MQAGNTVVKLEEGNDLRIHCSTTAFETVRKLIGSQIEKRSTLEDLSNEDLKGNIYSEVVKVKEKCNTTRRNRKALFTVNIYRTTGSLLINGPQVDHKCKNLSKRSYLQYRRGLNTMEQLLTCVTKN